MLHPFLSAPVRAWRQGAPGEAVDNSICINEKGDIYVEEEPIKQSSSSRNRYGRERPR